MRLATQIFNIDDLSKGPELIAEQSENDWPSINDPLPEPSSIPIKYDPHMEQYVPTVPVETADASKFLREYGNALLSPILGRDSAPFGRTGIFGEENGRPLNMTESAERSIKRLGQRNEAIYNIYDKLLR